jgi:leucyl-tRNA synthetase
MPQWAGSSWYYLRYMDPTTTRRWSKEALDYWSQVDWYNGGMEHTTLHLLYSRFWHKFLYDIGVVPTKEPYAKRTSHGMILGEGGEKMSKSRGNVVNPNDVVAQYGADTMRLYIMFIGDFEKAVPWSERGREGLQALPGPRLEPGGGGVRQLRCNAEERAAIHKTIKKVTRGHRRAEDEHRHRRHDDAGERVLRQRRQPGRPEGSCCCCSARLPRTS